ncbi:glucokinase [Telmatospirillum siberiense]|uniref:Glucokinase n=1 Tax=Telmatospirillum siberiense TaxID=382514 RepID=A0A2N3Q1M2_9PROT|nr:glucokinase [Telmatospirillum siberiense]PKU26554.1 glucokinase [Telmatospirillum siberiense]
MTQHTSRLIADIGGTNARFSLVYPGVAEPQDTRVLPCDDYDGLAEAATAYLEEIAPPVHPLAGAFAVACPVLGDRVELTNRDWIFSVAELKEQLGLERLEVVNDFIAVALSVPRLTDEHKIAVGGGTSVFGAPIAVIGPGTGLGVAGLLAGESGWQALPTEGGHVTMAAATEKEARILDWLRDRHGHVSAERVLSGPGLLNLYQALAALEGRTAEFTSPHEVTQGAQAGDSLAGETLATFFAMLGTVAGNLALTLGARGGLLIAGGIVPTLVKQLPTSEFRSRFESKGRFKSYLAAIPTHVITHPYPAFVGLAGLALRAN